MNRRTKITRSKVIKAVEHLGGRASYRQIAEEAGVSVASAHKFGEEAKALQAGKDLGLPDATPPQQVAGPVSGPAKDTTHSDTTFNSATIDEHSAHAKFPGKCDQCGERIEPGDEVLIDDNRGHRLPGKGGNTRKPIRHRECPAEPSDSPEAPDTPDTDDTGPDTPDTDFSQNLADLDDALSAPQSDDPSDGDQNPSDGQNSSPGATSQDGDPSEGDGSGSGDDPEDPYARQSWVMERIQPFREVLGKVTDTLADLGSRVQTNAANIDRHNERLEQVEVDLPRVSDNVDAVDGRLTDACRQIADNEQRIEKLEKRPAGGPSKLTVKVDDWGVDVELEDEHFHETFELALVTLKATKHLWLGGPTGGGKTHMAEQLSRALDLPFFMYSCTQGMLESKFEGKRWLDGSFQSTAWIEWGENGGVMLIDEADAMNDNVRLMLNSFLANGCMPLPNRIEQPLMLRHDKALIIIGTNTWGAGATGDYTGRDTIDLATRDRFSAMKVWVGYDRDLEHKIPEIAALGDFEELGNGKPWRPDTVGDSLAICFEKIRANIEKYGIPSQALSTRTKINAGKLKLHGVDAEDILQMYFTGWDEIDRNKALEGVAYVEVS
jgi:hypothetical protein